jgi:ABC-2 type transport system permease protein
MVAEADGPVAFLPGSRPQWRARRRSGPRGLTAELGAVVAVARHWIALGVRDRRFLLVAMLLPLNYMFLFLITVINGNQAPTALVVADHGPYARAFVRSLRSTDSFAMRSMDAAQARAAFIAGRVVARVTIPAGFDREVVRGHAAPVSLSVDNIENDFVDDLRRGMDQAINRFAAQRAPGGAFMVQQERDLHHRAIAYTPYVMVSVVVIALMVGGLFYGGTAAAREYEQRSIIDIILAPRSRVSILLGMSLGTSIVAAPGGLLLLTVVAFAFRMTAASWLELACGCVLVLFLYAAVGVLLGTVMRQRNGLSGLAVLVAIPMLSLSGAFYPVSWSSPVIGTIASFFPTYYANAIFQHAFYAVRTTPIALWIDYVAVIAFAVAMLAAGTALMAHREEAA